MIKVIKKYASGKWHLGSTAHRHVSILASFGSREPEGYVLDLFPQSRVRKCRGLSFPVENSVPCRTPAEVCQHSALL